MTNRRRPVDRASDIVAQHRHAQLDTQADEAMASEGWKDSPINSTNHPDYVAGLSRTMSTMTPTEP